MNSLRAAGACLLIALLIAASGASTQDTVPNDAMPNSSAPSSAGRDFAWESGGLALRIPDACERPATPSEDARRQPFISLTLPCPLVGGEFLMRLYPAQTTAAGAEAAFTETIAAHDMIPLRYAAAPLFGLPGLRGETISADRQSSGSAQSGRLPDGRILVTVSRGDGSPGANTALDQLVNSIAFSAASAPTPAQYRAAWQIVIGEPIVALTTAQDIVYAAGTMALYLLNRADGVLLGTFPYPDPMQVTGIGVSEGRDTLSLGDTLCRCTQQFSISRRTWLDPVDRFAANAPLDLAVQADTRYAVDLDQAAYALFTSAARTANPFQGDQAAPPLLVPGTQGVYSIEWVRSVIEGTVNGALILKAQDGDPFIDQFIRWLPYAPGELLDGAVYYHTLYALLREGTVVALSSEGDVTVLLTDLPASAAALALDSEATVYIASDQGDVAAFRQAAPSSLHGAPALVADVPVQGYLNEADPVQQWSYSPQGDERLTFNLTETSQANMLDAALRVLAPDGRELAFNDDQQGADLFSLLDPQIADLRLPIGTYTVEAEWIGGDGVYTLGVTHDRSFTPDTRGALELYGALMDVFPTQRWAFTATTSQALTFTMFGDSGTLDPALGIMRPDGTMLAYNDDAYDPELGVNAQLVRVVIPADGEYILEASRFEGAGAYTIVVVVN